MNALLVDLAKEVVVLGLGAVTTWVGTHVKKLARDLGAFFCKVRALEDHAEQLEARVKALEYKLLESKKIA